MDQCFRVSGTHRQPLLGRGRSDGPSRSPPTAAPGCGTTSCVDRKSTGFLWGLCEHEAKRDVMSLPFEHAVDDNEEEEVVKDALPVRHHHRVGRAHVRLALGRQRNSARWILMFKREGGQGLVQVLLSPSSRRSPWSRRWTRPAPKRSSVPPGRWKKTPQTLERRRGGTVK